MTSLSRFPLILMWFMAAGWLVSSGAVAQPSASDPNVRPARYSGSAIMPGPIQLPPEDSPAASDSKSGQNAPSSNLSSNVSAVRFSQVPTHVGDLALQETNVDLNLRTTITQSGQIAHQSTTSIHRHQHRGIEVLEVADRHVRRAQVAYRTSREKKNEDRSENEWISHPVEGKSYFVLRNQQAIVVTDLEGDIPPLDEFRIVRENMQTLGQPNPLTRYLLGRTFPIGQRFALPQEVASQLLGLGEPFGKIDRFELELLGTKQVDNRSCALFATTIEAIARDAGEMALQVNGQITIQLATCRTVVAELAGPARLLVEENTGKGTYQYLAEGTMKLTIHSKYLGEERSGVGGRTSCLW